MNIGTNNTVTTHSSNYQYTSSKVDTTELTPEEINNLLDALSLDIKDLMHQNEFDIPSILYKLREYAHEYLDDAEDRRLFEQLNDALYPNHVTGNWSDSKFVADNMDEIQELLSKMHVKIDDSLPELQKTAPQVNPVMVLLQTTMLLLEISRLVVKVQTEMVNKLRSAMDNVIAFQQLMVNLQGITRSAAQSHVTKDRTIPSQYALWGEKEADGIAWGTAKDGSNWTSSENIKGFESAAVISNYQQKRVNPYHPAEYVSYPNAHEGYKVDNVEKIPDCLLESYFVAGLAGLDTDYKVKVCDKDGNWQEICLPKGASPEQVRAFYQQTLIPFCHTSGRDVKDFMPGMFTCTLYDGRLASKSPDSCTISKEFVAQALIDVFAKADALVPHDKPLTERFNFASYASATSLDSFVQSLQTIIKQVDAQISQVQQKAELSVSQANQLLQKLNDYVPAFRVSLVSGN